MGRFFASLVVGLLIFGAIAWHLKLIPVSTSPTNPPPKKPVEPVDLGGNLFMPTKLELDDTGAIPLGKGEDPITIQGELRTIDTDRKKRASFDREDGAS